MDLPPLNVRFLTNFNVCNFRCEYCIAGQSDRDDPRMKEHFDVARYRLLLQRIGALPYALNVRIGVRGELFLSPEMIDGARELSTRPNLRSLNLITNLGFSAARYQRLLQGFDTSK